MELALGILIALLILFPVGCRVVKVTRERDQEEEGRRAKCIEADVISDVKKRRERGQ